MKEETLYCFSFLCDSVAALVDAAPLLQKLVLQDISIIFKMILWGAYISLRNIITGPNPELYVKGANQ